MLLDNAIITSYNLNTLHPAPQVRNLPCIAKYLYYCRNDPFENVGETIALQCKCHFLACRPWPKRALDADFEPTCIQFSDRSRLIKLLVILIMCNTSHFFCQIISIVSICSVNPEHADYNWVSWNVIFSDKNWTRKLTSLLFSHQFFSPFSPSVSCLYCLPFCFYSSFFQILIISHLLVREAFDS